MNIHLQAILDYGVNRRVKRHFLMTRQPKVGTAVKDALGKKN
jgi:hypothetical protein